MRLFPITWRSLMAVILVIWLLILVYITISLHQGYTSSEDSALSHHNLNVEKLQIELRLQNTIVKQLEQRLTSKEQEVDKVNRQLEESEKIASDLKMAALDVRKAVEMPSPVASNDISRFGGEHMSRVEYNIRELWNYFTNNLENTHLMEFKDRMHMLSSDLTSLKSSLGPSGWREKKFISLSEKMQNSFYRLQNPRDCKKAQLLICNLDKLCGYGCQMHHLIYCFIVSYGTGRTMILKGRDWKYSKKGWLGTYQAVSDTCTSFEGDTFEWSEINQDKRILRLPLVDFMNYKPDFMPLSVPKSYFKDLKHIHADPFVWFVGQILKFLLKPNAEIQKLMDSLNKILVEKHPIIGVHIRRTDKVGTEAAFHDITEYMKHVHNRFEYYDQLYQRNVTRRIYLATDDSNLISSARKQYSNYEIIGDSSISLTAQLNQRYTDSSLSGIITDVHLLSKTDFLVCTFSSQVCRIAYEIMQQNNEDMSANFHSLDDFYYYGGQKNHDYIARRDHLSAMKKGDLMGVAGNHWDGNMMSKNKRTNIQKTYPAYKMEDVKKEADFLGEKN